MAPALISAMLLVFCVLLPENSTPNVEKGLFTECSRGKLASAPIGAAAQPQHFAHGRLNPPETGILVLKEVETAVAAKYAFRGLNIDGRFTPCVPWR